MPKRVIPLFRLKTDISSVRLKTDKTNKTKSFVYIDYFSFYQTLFIAKGIRCKREKEISECQLEHYVNFCLRMDHE